MATDTIPNPAPRAKSAAQSAYWESSFFLEDVANDAERLSETAFCLSTAEAFDMPAQHSFYALGELASKLQQKLKSAEKRFEKLSKEGEAQ